MATPNRRLFLSAAGAASLAAVLAACADTGADGRAVSSSSASAGAVDYNTVINSGPVAADDAVAASTWASAIKVERRRVSTRPPPLFFPPQYRLLTRNVLHGKARSW